MKSFNKTDLYSYSGSYEDFTEKSDRYYAQLAIEFHGSAVRDNSIVELIEIGRDLDKKGNYIQ